MSVKVLTFSLVSFVSTAVADDFTTTNGREHKDATVTRIEPDGIVIKSKSGITKVYFTELPKEIQERFKYDPQKASAYSAEQAANYGAYQKQQQDAQLQREEAAAKNNAILAEQAAAQTRIQSLQARYDELQKQEDDLLRQIGEAKQPGPAYYGGKNDRTVLHHPNPQKSQSPLFQSHLNDVRREKSEVRKQLHKAQP